MHQDFRNAIAHRLQRPYPGLAEEQCDRVLIGALFQLREELSASQDWVQELQEENLLLRSRLEEIKSLLGTLDEIVQELPIDASEDSEELCLIQSS